MPTLDYQHYAKMARRAAAEGIVLLANRAATLPVAEGAPIAVFGRTQYDTIYCGTGSGGLVNVPYVISIAEGLEARYTLDAEVTEAYGKWLPDHPFDEGEGWARTPWSQEEMPVPDALMTRAAERSAYGFVVIGRSAGEDRDSVAEKGAYYLSDAEMALLRQVRAAFDRLIVILNTGNILDMAWMEEIKPDAALYVWQGGCEGGHAVADVVSGAVNPSGRLPDTIAKTIEDYPSHKNFGGDDSLYYQEDIYVGYRYFETFAPDRVVFPFAYGLSYTTFSLAVTDFAADDRSVHITGEVTNTGDVGGKTAWQVYLEAPQGALGQPVRRLAGFGKTESLAPGESETVTCTMAWDDLATFDDSGVTGHKDAWVLEAGTYRFHFGSDIRQTVEAGVYELASTRCVRQLEEALAPIRPFERMKPAMDDDGVITLEMEATPLRTVDYAERVSKRAAAREDGAATKVTADENAHFEAWCRGEITLDAYLATLRDIDLIHLARGIGMAPSGVTPGVAGAFGGVSEHLRATGMPLAACADGPSGIRMDNGTMAYSLPNGTALAASFNDKLNETLFELLGLELRKNKIESLLGPGINIHRHPLNGRNFEYFSEDPLLTGRIATAQIRGMAKYRVAGTVKHFAFNNQEHARNDSDSIVSQRAAREIYLKPFEMLTASGKLKSIMTSYNRINGIWAASNYELNTTILREQWGYDGIVMTDWWAKMNWAPYEAGDRKQIGAMIRAQNDLYMVSVSAETNGNDDRAEEALEAGRYTRGDLLRNAENVCRFLRDHYHGYHPLELEVLNEPEIRDKDVTHLDIGKVEGSVPLDLSDVVPGKGSTVAIAFEAVHYGNYELLLELVSDAEEVAQINVTVSLNNIPQRTIPITGSGEHEERVLLHVSQNPNNYIDLRFSEGGLTIRRAELKWCDADA